MPFDRDKRLALLRERAVDYTRVALVNIEREFPHMPYFVATGPGPHPSHRALHPAFFGCFDWHSSVEMHWVVVRLLRRFPAEVAASGARTTLDRLLTREHLAAERDFFAAAEHRSLERPYGWGWLLTLAHELETWDDPDGRRWSAAVAPLAELLASNLVSWLPRLTYPQRTGVHPNTAFALSRAYPYATLRASRGDPALLLAIQSSAPRWFAADTDYPAHYEPSGADFLSAALCEAELMSHLTPPGEYGPWLERFLPGLAQAQPVALFAPATVSDSTDGQIAHLHGLNLSRAWAFSTIASRVPDGDARAAPLLAAAEAHAMTSLPHVAGSDYAVEHWLAAYATLLLSE